MMNKLIATMSAVLALTLSAGAADTHEHEKGKAGPNGGKLITAVEPHAEFFVNKDKKVEIRFIGEDGKVVAPAAQEVTVTMGERSAPTKLAFAKEGDALVSDKAIPDGNELPTVVQIREKAGAKAVNEKFNLNLNKCPECSNAEYACICAHDGDDHKH